MVLGTANSVLPENASQEMLRIKAQQEAQRRAEEEGEMGISGEMGGGDFATAATKYNASRFAFVVQVIEAESFVPDGDGQ